MIYREVGESSIEPGEERLDKEGGTCECVRVKGVIWMATKGQGLVREGGIYEW